MSYNYKIQMKATPREGVNGQGESNEKWWNVWERYLLVRKEEEEVWDGLSLRMFLLNNSRLKYILVLD